MLILKRSCAMPGQSSVLRGNARAKQSISAHRQNGAIQPMGLAVYSSASAMAMRGHEMPRRCAVCRCHAIATPGSAKRRIAAAWRSDAKAQHICALRRQGRASQCAGMAMRCEALAWRCVAQAKLGKSMLWHCDASRREGRAQRCSGEAFHCKPRQCRASATHCMS